MSECHICGIPADAGFFDQSSVVAPPAPGQEMLKTSTAPALASAIA